MIEQNNTKIIVDVGPDHRSQMISHSVDKIDGVIFTHFHADHVAGIDDIKALSQLMKGSVPAYANQETYDGLARSYSYIFKPYSTNTPAIMQMQVINNWDEFKIGDINIQSFPQDHFTTISLGLRFGNLAYSTDVCNMDEKAFELLKGVKIWVIDCLRYSFAPSHLHFERTIEWINRIKPQLAILTHMAHDMEYNELKNMLPANIVPAYDGLVFEL
jgi:phosphoribosyl 1,2-cyclic phosphate phosphodiesterase